MRTTRRDLLLAALAAGLLRARPALAQPGDDTAVVEEALALERVAVMAYDRTIRLLRGDERALAERVREHEREHVDILSTALDELGGVQPHAPAPGDVSRLAGLDSRGDALALLIEIEEALVAVYHDAHARLQDAKLLATVAAIMAGEGQHLVVLRELLGRDAVPDAFETGRASSTIVP